MSNHTLFLGEIFNREKTSPEFIVGGSVVEMSVLNSGKTEFGNTDVTASLLERRQL